MGFLDLPLILGICMGYYFWRWKKGSGNMGFFIYSVYYFNSRASVQHARAVDAPAFYDMYHEVFKGRASYADYLRAVDGNYDDALATISDETRKVNRILAKSHSILILSAGLVVALIAWSINAYMLFLLGVFLYFIARYIKFLIQDDARQFLYTKLITDEAIKTYRRSKKKDNKH